MSGYRLYQNKEDQFGFEIPADCTEVAFTTYAIPTAAGEGKLKGYSTGNSSKMFMLGITDLGMDIDDESGIQVMEYAKAQVIQESRLIASKKTKCAGFPALKIRIARMENKIQIFADIVFCIIRDKQFQLEVMTAIETGLDEGDAAHFFSSFQYTGFQEADSEE